MAVVDGAAAGRRALVRGANLIQLRMPGRDVRLIEEEAARLLEMELPLVVSDRVDVAMAVGAPGVNLPADSLPLAVVRSLLPSALVGRSTHSREAARAAEAEGADWVLFGPVFQSRSHLGQEGQGLARLAEVCAAVKIPVIAIGGMDEERALAARRAGARGFAAISLFQG